MRTSLTAALVVALCVSEALAQKPKTVDEAVQTLKTKWLKPKDLDWVLRNPKDEVVWTLYRPFGTGVRNQFGLWGDNQALRDSCGDNNPEGCSVVIFNRLWESVRSDADPSLVRQLDCQFQLAKSIHINRKEFYKMTTGELLKALQLQIDDQLAQLKKTGSDLCQDKLTLVVEGKHPDAHCFVDAPFAKELADNDNLEEVLAGLGSLNLFTSSHMPPRITLNFLRKCQFPTPPYLYGASPRKR
jgi:hypothetical protein